MGGRGWLVGTENGGENVGVWQAERMFFRIIFTSAFLLFLYETHFYPDFARGFLRSGGPFFGMQIVPTVGSGFFKGMI
jgi:hypothetical protein